MVWILHFIALGLWLGRRHRPVSIQALSVVGAYLFVVHLVAILVLRAYPEIIDPMIGVPESPPWQEGRW